ncbi:MAG TPA: TlpA disulfide reductase family protein [Myxococcota bacterium]|nr:TlpA disulfide reductase family protein [Myxococcota bacterium]
MSRTRFLLPVLLAAILVVSLAACSGATTKPGERPAQAAGVAGDFALHDLAGNTVRLSDYGDKVVYLSFWASWCEPCRSELPQLQKIWERLRGQGFELLSIVVDPSDLESTVRRQVHRYRYRFPVLLDQDTEVANRFNPTMTLPFGVLLDRRGRIAYTHKGYRIGDEQLVEDKIGKLLSQ